MATKLGLATLGAILLIPVLIAALVHGAFSAIVGSSTQPSQEALADIPGDYLDLYQAAAPMCPGLDWSILAAIGKLESNHGRSTLVGVADGTQNSAGAGGPMQFLQSTFDSVVSRHTIPPGGKTPPSPWNKHDAIYAAAFYLCDAGARDGRDLRAAVFAYNHADWYVDQVLAQAAQYSEATPSVSVACGSFQSSLGSGADQFSGDAALAAVGFACAQLGKPYVWGGNGSPGFDCSGLTHAAYAAAGIDIPRTAQTQYNVGPRLPEGAPLQPGDLVFFGIPNNIHHVGISLGGTLIVHAPDFGQSVRVQDLRDFPDYAGSSRPAL